ncbi:MAG: hypothetical protein ACYTEU_08000 [Planctomycetota bacterium]|jgi:hypothetical protein
MEVLSGGFTTKFWIPIEDEPDIDRFIDEDIAVDMDSFVVRGLLKKVSTCKKKNKETKEFEYYKELTIEVVGIDTEEGQSIAIPDKKEDYGYHVEFRYVPVDGPLDETADETLADAAADGSAEPGPEEELDFEDDGSDMFSDDEEEQAELDHRREQELEDEEEQTKNNSIGAPEEDDFFPPEEEADAFQTAVEEDSELTDEEAEMDAEGDQVGKEDNDFSFDDEDPEPELSETTVVDDDEFFDETPTKTAKTEPVKPVLPDDDDDGIDWD